MSDWSEDQRGTVLGHRLHKGHYLTHIMEVRDAGPGAISCTAVCNGVQSWTMLLSKADSEHWQEQKQESVRFVDWPHIAVVDPKWACCANCRRRYTRRREQARGAIA